MYEYQVDKYWLVVGVQADGQLIFKTRRGKQHVFSASDPRLRKASLWERIFKSKLFPTLNGREAPTAEAPAKPTCGESVGRDHFSCPLFLGCFRVGPINRCALAPVSAVATGVLTHCRLI